MFAVSASDHNSKMMFVSLSYSILMAISFTYTLITKKLKFFYIAVYSMVFYLECNFLHTGGTEGFGIIWMTVIPLFSIYLFEKKEFYIVNIVVLFILIMAMWTPFNKYAYSFKPSFSKRFPLVYILSFAFSVFLKYRITKTEKELQLQKDTLSKEIQQAATIQKTFLSKPRQYFKYWTLGYKNIPMAGVSGDFYDIYGENNVLDGISIFDISGHGVASGLLSLLAKTIIDNAINYNFSHTEDLWETVQYINDQFIKYKGEVPNYLTGILVKISENKIELVNAGHQYPILYRKATDSFEVIEKDPKSQGAIGLTDFTSIYISQYFEMDSGDELILYTDGLPDCLNEEGEAYGNERLFKTLKQYIRTDVNEQVRLTLQDIKLFAGTAPVTDDMTLIILRKD